jgi:fructose-1,6-bisphosphatase
MEKTIPVYKRAVASGAEGSVVKSILDACVEISAFLRHSPIVKLETFNLFGDEQLHQDIVCDGIIEKHLKLNQLVKGFASEERPHYQSCGEGEGYVVTYDPLDGSSIIDTNFAIGCIFSIWKTHPHNLIGAKLRDQVNAVVCIFGPRTTAVYYNPSEDKVQEVTAVEDHWIISHDHLTITQKTNIFSPGNLRSASEN